MESYLNIDGVGCVTIENADGSIWSGLKSAYEAQQAEQSTLIVKPSGD